MVTDPPPSEEAPEPEPGYEERERRARIAERWRFDEDDTPAVGPQGSEEYDRVLLDDYDLKWVVFGRDLPFLLNMLLRYQTQSMKWLTERDYTDLATDQSIPSVKNGQVKAHIPYYLGQMIVRRG
jgi:enhancer of polycomb-like protein